MSNTLVISRAKKLYPEMKRYLEKFGYKNITFTNLERDGLYSKIDEINPRLILMSSNYNQAATPFMIGELLKTRPKLNIAAVAINDFPISIAPWFIWHGAKSCLHLWADGLDEFNFGLQELIKGREYISPIIQKVINLFPEWPDTKGHLTKRQFECLILLCCGFTSEDIASEMFVSRKTIDNTIYAMFEAFNVKCKEELIYCAWSSNLVKKEDLKYFPKNKRIMIPKYLSIRNIINKKLGEIYKNIYDE